MSLVPAFSSGNATQQITLPPLNSGGGTQVCEIFSPSDNRVISEAQKTATQFGEFVAKMQQQFAILSEQNLTLRQELVASESRQRETEFLYTTQIEAYKTKDVETQETIAKLRQQLSDVMRQTDERATQLILDKTEAVQAATKMKDTEIQALKQEIDSAHKSIKELQVEVAKTRSDADQRVRMTEMQVSNCYSQNQATLIQEFNAHIQNQNARLQQASTHFYRIAKEYKGNYVLLTDLEKHLVTSIPLFKG